MMSNVFCGLFVTALLFGALSGNLSAVATAMPKGAADAVNLILSIGGSICVWQGIMEVMDKSGLSDKIAKVLSPIISLFLGRYRKDKIAREALSQNMSANLLGLGNAATPAGLRAASRLSKLSGAPNSNVVLKLIILNTASMQLIPTNVAAVRAAAGAENPFSILPAVWVASVASVAAAMLAYSVFSHFSKDSE